MSKVQNIFNELLTFFLIRFDKNFERLQWEHVNATYEYTYGHARRILIYSPEMKEWLTKADEKLIMYPVFPLEMKGKINRENENG